MNKLKPLSQIKKPPPPPTAATEKITLTSIQREIETRCEPFLEEVMTEVREQSLKGYFHIASLCPNNGWSFTHNNVHLQCVVGMLKRRGFVVTPNNSVLEYSNGFNVTWEFPFDSVAPENN